MLEIPAEFTQETVRDGCCRRSVPFAIVTFNRQAVCDIRLYAVIKRFELVFDRHIVNNRFRAMSMHFTESFEDRGPIPEIVAIIRGIVLAARNCRQVSSMRGFIRSRTSLRCSYLSKRQRQTSRIEWGGSDHAKSTRKLWIGSEILQNIK